MLFSLNLYHTLDYTCFIIYSFLILNDIRCVRRKWSMFLLQNLKLVLRMFRDIVDHRCTRMKNNLLAKITTNKYKNILLFVFNSTAYIPTCFVFQPSAQATDLATNQNECYTRERKYWFASVS